MDKNITGQTRPEVENPQVTVGKGSDEAAAQFRLLVETIPGCAFVTLDNVGRVQTWTATAERLTGWTADEVVGRDLSVFFADGALRTVGPRLHREGTLVEVEATAIPVNDVHGEPQGFIQVLRDMTAQKTAENELAVSEAAFRAVVETAADPIIVIGEDGLVQSFNGAAERAFGYSAAEIIGQNISELMPEPHRSQHDGYLAHYRQTGEARIIGRGREVEARRKDGSNFPAELAVAAWTVGARRGFTGILRDVTERKRAEERLHLITRELSHRMKNLFAVVQAMAWQTARASEDVRDFDKRFTSRLQSMARSYDLLVKGEWRSVLLGDLVRAQLAPFLDNPEQRLHASGPELFLRPAMAQDLGLALHELATNALKYGALSSAGGRIEVIWSTEEDYFHLSWREIGGPPVSLPKRRGFGHMVVQSIQTAESEVSLEFPSEGVVWRLRAPAALALI